MPLLDHLGNRAGCSPQDFSVGLVLLVTYGFIPKRPCSQHLYLPWLHIEEKASQLHAPTSGTAEKDSEPILHCWTSPLKFGGGSPASVAAAPSQLWVTVTLASASRGGWEWQSKPWQTNFFLGGSVEVKRSVLFSLLFRESLLNEFTFSNIWTSHRWGLASSWDVPRHLSCSPDEDPLDPFF